MPTSSSSTFNLDSTARSPPLSPPPQPQSSAAATANINSTSSTTYTTPNTPVARTNNNNNNNNKSTAIDLSAAVLNRPRARGLRRGAGAGGGAMRNARAFLFLSLSVLAILIIFLISSRIYEPSGPLDGGSSGGGGAAARRPHHLHSTIIAADVDTNRDSGEKQPVDGTRKPVGDAEAASKPIPSSPTAPAPSATTAAAAPTNPVDPRRAAAIESAVGAWLAEATSLALRSPTNAFSGVLQTRGGESGMARFLLPQCLLVPQLRTRYGEVAAGAEEYLAVVRFAGSTLIDGGFGGGGHGDGGSVPSLEHLVVPNLGVQLLRLAGWLGGGRLSIVVEAAEATSKVDTERDQMLALLKSHLDRALDRPTALNTTADFAAPPPTPPPPVPGAVSSSATHLLLLTPTLFCASDVLEMAYQHVRQGAHHTCGMELRWDADATQNGFRGAMVPTAAVRAGVRDMGGRRLFESPSMWHKQAFAGDPVAEDRFDRQLPVQVLSCPLTTPSLVSPTFRAPTPPPPPCNGTVLAVTTRSVLVPTSKFAYPVSEDRVAGLVRGSTMGLLRATDERVSGAAAAYAVARREASPPAILRSGWAGGERIDGADADAAVPGLVQGVWKQGPMMDEIAFVEPDAVPAC
ncbi:hypothetical protein DFJ73DRAFT_962183 [Zopfochytrium polystomum]|nr:hypothetical protein DFJ73DRAFT_962183 [Zopfochytrium polystomum]